MPSKFVLHIKSVRRAAILLAVSLSLALGGYWAVLAQGSFEMPLSSQSLGGGTSSSANFELQGSAGGVIGESQSANFRLQSGFWPPVRQLRGDLTVLESSSGSKDRDDDDDDDDDDDKGSTSGGGGGGAPPELDVTSAESSSETISPNNGGIVDTGFGDTVEASVEVPPGALDQDVDIQIEAILITDPALPPPPAGTLSRAFRFSPPGFQFLAPIFITIFYEESEVAGMDENTYKPILLVGNEWVVVEDCSSPQTPMPDPCLVSRDPVNNELIITTTRFSIYGVQGDFLPTPPVATAAGLMPLGDNLARVWHFNDATEAWSFSDPRPIFAEANTLKELVHREAFFIKVNHDQTAIWNDQEHRLSAGWNQIGW